MPKSLPVILALGFGVMWIPVLMQGIWKKITVWKTIVISLALVVFGTLGAMLLFFVENGAFGGFSYYGAIFLVALTCFPVAKLLKMPYSLLTDLSAPAGCAMLVFMRIRCYMSGCCNGIYLYTVENNRHIYFPSQLTELGLGIVLTVVLLWLSRKKKFSGTVYGWYMLLYGLARFVLNFFRADNAPFVWILPPGHLWSLVSIAIGATWLTLKLRKPKTA